MNLDNVTAELRPRSEWEAADLGARMIRRDARIIYALWFSITLPMFLLAVLAILYSPYPYFVGVLYWWFEPIVDGPILHVISRRLFGERVGYWETLREVPRLAWRNKIFWLTPYRFHFARSVAIPVTQLEMLKGSARRARAKTLNSRIMNYGTGITIAYQHLFLSIYIGVVLVIYALVPTVYQDSAGSDLFSLAIDDQSRTTVLLQLVLTYLAQTILHPWFVGGGFGLYINCRTRLEAWDIEVAFRRMVQRQRAGAVAAAALLAVLPLFLLSSPGYAQEEDGTDLGFSGYWEDEEVDEALETIFESEALSTFDESTVWRPIKDPDAADEDDDKASAASELFKKISLLFSYLVEIWLWLVVILLLALLYVSRQTWLPYLRGTSRPKEKAHRIVLSSGEITASTLPDDIPAAVRQLWNEGSKRQAVSLLFRGSVYHAVARYGVRLPPSATEGDCVTAVKSHSGIEFARYFENVVLTWVWCAYGSVTPDDAAFDLLCDDWSNHYSDAQ